MEISLQQAQQIKAAVEAKEKAIRGEYEQILKTKEEEIQKRAEKLQHMQEQMQKTLTELDSRGKEMTDLDLEFQFQQRTWLQTEAELTAQKEASKKEVDEVTKKMASDLAEREKLLEEAMKIIAETKREKERELLKQEAQIRDREQTLTLVNLEREKLQEELEKIKKRIADSPAQTTSGLDKLPEATNSIPPTTVAKDADGDTRKVSPVVASVTELATASSSGAGGMTSACVPPAVATTVTSAVTGAATITTSPPDTMKEIAKFLSHGQKAPEYHAGGNIDIFLSRFEDFVQLKEIPEEKQAGLLIDALKDDTAYMAVARELSKEEKRDYQAIKRHLVYRFDTMKEKGQKRLVMRSTYQKAGQDLQAFFNEILGIAAKAYPTRKTDDIDEDVIDTFILGLKEDALRLHVVGREPKTSKEALSIALSYEAALIYNASIHGVSVPRTTTEFCRS